MLDNPRWADFEYEYVDGNGLGWFGNGWSERDHGNDMARTYYLDGQAMLREPLEKTIAVANGHLNGSNGLY